jgi:hypothetical protein
MRNSNPGLRAFIPKERRRTKLCISENKWARSKVNSFLEAAFFIKVHKKQI